VTNLEGNSAIWASGGAPGISMETVGGGRSRTRPPERRSPAGAGRYLVRQLAAGPPSCDCLRRSGSADDSMAHSPSTLLDGRNLRSYALGSAIWLVVYLFLPEAAKPAAFLATALGAVPAVGYGLTRVQRGKRLPWWLLLVALSVLILGLIVRLVDNDRAVAGVLLNATGNVLLLASATALIMRCGRTDVGGVIDASIIGLAVGGVLCIAVFSLADAVDRAERVNLFVVLFALSGVLGALVRLARVLTQPVAALWWLMLGLTSALIANIVLAATTDPLAIDAANILFMAAYTSVGAFGLHSSAPRLVRHGFVSREDDLSKRRLVLLGVALAAIPIVVGVLILLERTTTRDGVVLLVGAALIATLVMVRIGRMSAERARTEQALRQQATVDPLTGLPNRRTFLTRLTEALDRRQRCAVLFCDLDGFKAVNDRWGHGVGDELLRHTAERLVASVRESDTVSRFGGDEFLILLAGATPSSVDIVVRRIQEAFGIPVHLSIGALTLGASIGLAASAEGTAVELINAADALMYDAKRAQGSTPSIRVMA
jgi:diguanylate cyclase (GGDEF)-like protein